MRRHVFWFVELFVWLLILVLVSGGIIFARYNHRKNFNTYRIFLPDVDGLINGSPVKFMGIQIGYVNQIDIVGEEVFVKFIITQKGIKIPQSSIATVEFSGLGGSKSLEIYPPTPKSKLLSDKIIIPEKPKRIHESLGILNDMFGDVADITYDFSYFMNEVGLIKKENTAEKQGTIKQDKSTPPDVMLNQINDWLDRAQVQSVKFRKKIDNFGKKEVKTTNKINKTNETEKIETGN